MHHSLGHHQTPTHTARKPAGIGLRLVGKAHGFEDLVCAALRFGHTVIARLIFEALARCEKGVDD